MSPNRLIRYAGVCLALWAITLFYPCIDIRAEEDIWVTLEAEVPVADSRANARQVALNRARQLAIAKAVGPGLAFKDLYVHSRLGGSMAHAIPHGKIVKSEVLTERATIMTGGVPSSAGSNYKIRIKAAVKKTAGGKNPAFRIFASLNQGAFFNGDEMRLRIQSTTDCYLMAFVLMEDGRVLKLLPSALGHDAFLPAGQHLEFPSPEDAQRGIRLRAHLTETNTLLHEAIYILALRQPIKGTTDGIKEGIYPLYDGQTAQLNALVSQIASIPPDQRAEALVYYQILPRADT